MTLLASSPLASTGACTLSFSITSWAGWNGPVALGSGVHHCHGEGAPRGWTDAGAEGIGGGRYATGRGREVVSRVATRPEAIPRPSTPTATSAAKTGCLVEAGTG